MRNKLRLEKRESVSTIRIVLTSILFTLIAFAFCGIIIASVGFNPLEVYGKMLNKVFLSGKGIRKNDQCQPATDVLRTWCGTDI